MHIVTCGDNRKGTNSHGDQDDGPTFREMIEVSVLQARRLGCEISVFDLGGLGVGEPHAVDDENFRERGFYRQVGAFKSKALHKPSLVRRALARAEQLAYLDGDAVLLRAPEPLPPGVDLAVTLRLPYELDTPFWQRNREVASFINAGVILFRRSPRTAAFIDRWQEHSARLGSDQYALNDLVAPAGLDAVGGVQQRAGVRVLYLSSQEYNFYHFHRQRPPAETRILHFKSPHRALFRVFFP